MNSLIVNIEISVGFTKDQFVVAKTPISKLGPSRLSPINARLRSSGSEQLDGVTLIIKLVYPPNSLQIRLSERVIVYFLGAKCAINVKTVSGHRQHSINYRSPFAKTHALIGRQISGLAAVKAGTEPKFFLSESADNQYFD
jgi:hypothetical protein